MELELSAEMLLALLVVVQMLLHVTMTIQRRTTMVLVQSMTSVVFVADQVSQRATVTVTATY